MSEVQESWYDWTYDGRGWYLVNDPEITFYSEDEANAYCDEHNRAWAGLAAIAERKRITDIIRDRINVVHHTIDICARSEIRVPTIMFDAINELRLVLREIEKEQNT